MKKLLLATVLLVIASAGAAQAGNAPLSRGHRGRYGRRPEAGQGG